MDEFLYDDEFECLKQRNGVNENGQNKDVHEAHILWVLPYFVYSNLYTEKW